MDPGDRVTALAELLRAAIFAKTGYRMSIESIKAALLHLPGVSELTMQYGGGGTDNIFKLGALRVPVPAKASVEEVIAAISAAVPVAQPSAPAAHVTPLPAAPVLTSAAVSPAPSAPVASTGVLMSITGLQEGAFANKIAELKAKIADAQSAGLAKIDAGGAAALVKVDATVASVTARIDTEIAAALAELTIGNGGPA
jgi:hypothetical protein